jgi:hypothetical protein
MVVSELNAFLGIAMKTERCVLGFSQEELADCSRLHRTHVSGVERAAYIISPVVFQGFSKFIPRLEMEWALLKRSKRDPA